MKVGSAGDYQDARFNETTYHRSRSLITSSAFDVMIYDPEKNSYNKGLNTGFTNRITAASARCVKYADADEEPANN